MNLLGHHRLRRTGGACTTERTSADFLIDGQSLLEMLVRHAGGHADFMGCLVSGYAKECRRVTSMLLDTTCKAGKHVLLYLCPECGDIGCGAYSALVRCDGESYVWESFAYQTSESDVEPVAALGPFCFDADRYAAAIRAAAKFDGAE